MKTISTRQREILSFIKEFIATNKFPPTCVEIAAKFGFASPNAASCHLFALEKKNLIQRIPRISRGISITPLGDSI